jgi:hypothetical protein
MAVAQLPGTSENLPLTHLDCAQVSLVEVTFFEVPFRGYDQQSLLDMLSRCL